MEDNLNPQPPAVAKTNAEPVQLQPASQPERVNGEKNSSRAGALGVATIVLGNIATFTGAISSFNEQGQKLQEQLHLGATPYLLYVLVALIFAGYFLASTTVYKHLKRKIGNRMPGKGVAVGALVFVAMGGLFAVNVLAIPDTGGTILKSRKEVWVNKIRQTQQDSGGFSVMLPSGPGNPVQAFTTAQGLTAMLSAMNWDKVEQEHIKAIRSAFDFIDSVRDPVEGGWAYFGNSGPLTEIAGWVTVARIKALEHGDQVWPSEPERRKQLGNVEKDLAHLMAHYVPAANAWSPFSPNVSETSSLTGCTSLPPGLKGLTDNQSKTRTYSTVMALWALIEAHRVTVVRDRVEHRNDNTVRDGIGWLLTTYSKEQGSWLPNPHRANQREDYPGLTGQVLYVLYLAKADPHFSGAVEQPRWAEARRAFLNKHVKDHLLGDNSHLSDMDGYVFPFPQPLEPMTFLWAPWSMIAYKHLSTDSDLSPSERKLAITNLSIISADYRPEVFEAIEAGGTYELAENLFCMSEAFR